jgi:hypothetical protein
MLTATPALAVSFDSFYLTKNRTAELMFNFGGSFAQGLALALRHADRDNSRRIYEAFPELLTPYSPGGKFHPA